jgi:hypothetical protein
MTGLKDLVHEWTNLCGDIEEEDQPVMLREPVHVKTS